jgi:hypothetical protein
MSLILDSEPYFKAKAVAIGLDAATLAALKIPGVSTLAELTFFTTYQPGTPDDTPLVDALKAALQVDPAPPNVLIKIRRLHFEAHALCLADMKQRVTASDEDTPKKVPAPERAQRHEDQQNRLAGLVLKDDLECSRSLLDIVMQQHEQNEARYISLEKCTSREQELCGAKKDSMLSLDTDGQIKIKPGQNSAKADLTTDLKVKAAFTRRGLAYDQAGLLDFHAHNAWVEKLFRTTQKAAPDGFATVSLQQILNADREIWKLMLDERRAGVVGLAGQPQPLTEAMKKLMDSPDVVYFLLPLPTKTSTSSSSTTALANSNHAQAGVQNNFKKWRKGGGKGSFFRSGKGKGKGKDGGKGHKGSPQMPSGCVNKTTDGKRLCFGYNSPRGCEYAGPGQQCMKGYHLCARPNCFGKHTAVGCSKDQ